MPWVPLDTFYADDPKIQQAGEATPFALSVFPFLLAQAKLRANGGSVEITYRDVAHKLFLSSDEARKAIGALTAAGVLELDDADDLSASVSFPSAAWRRWNENFRKQQLREQRAA